MRKVLLAGSMVVLAGCSESFGALVSNACATPIDVEASTSEDVAPQVTTVATGETAEVWSYCCAPGVDGELVLAVGEWSTTVTFDQLRDDGVVAVPESACPRG